MVGRVAGGPAVDAVGCVDDERRLRQDRRGLRKHPRPLLFLLLLRPRLLVLLLLQPLLLLKLAVLFLLLQLQ